MTEATSASPEACALVGLPRGKHWIRIQASDEIPMETVSRLADEDDLSSEIQNGYLLVHGEKEKIKAFVKR